jgi:hypothetical protein
MAGIKDGGPAFPRSGYEVDRETASACDTWPQDGMTLRDYFAAAALTGYLAGHAGDGIFIPHEKTAAVRAYEFADAMIAERGEPNR